MINESIDRPARKIVEGFKNLLRYDSVTCAISDCGRILLHRFWAALRGSFGEVDAGKKKAQTPVIYVHYGHLTADNEGALAFDTYVEE